MTAVWVVLAALLAAACVLVAARAWLAPGSAAAPSPDSDAGEAERVGLLEERDRALAALQELEFDHRTGKISDEDYRDLVGPLRQDAARALVALDGAGMRAAEPPGGPGAQGDPPATEPAR